MSEKSYVSITIKKPLTTFLVNQGKENEMEIAKIAISRGKFKGWYFTRRKDWINESKFNENEMYFSIDEDSYIKIYKNIKKENGEWDKEEKEVSAKEIEKMFKKSSYKKMASSAGISMMLFMSQQSSVYASGIGFNENAAKDLINSIFQPATSFLLWAVPVVIVAVSIWNYLSWLGKDEDERDQKPFSKTLFKICKWGVVVWCVPAILKIFGM